MELTLERKPINEMLLANSNSQSEKGVRGFQKSTNPKTIHVGFLVTPHVKAFLNEYCSLNEITLTKLFLAGLECYTGFNGSNHEEIITELKAMINDNSCSMPGSEK
jgi:hypothetical protein